MEASPNMMCRCECYSLLVRVVARPNLAKFYYMVMVPSAYSNTPRSMHLLIDSKLCISSCTIVQTRVKHQQWEVFFIYSRSASDAKQTNRTYALSVRSLQYFCNNIWFPSRTAAHVHLCQWQCCTYTWVHIGSGIGEYPSQAIYIHRCRRYALYAHH